MGLAEDGEERNGNSEDGNANGAANFGVHLSCALLRGLGCVELGDKREHDENDEIKPEAEERSTYRQ